MSRRLPQSDGLRGRAVAALRADGWTDADIVRVLLISHPMLARLDGTPAVAKLPEPKPRARSALPEHVQLPAAPLDVCCQKLGSLYCDRPVMVAGGVFCAMHTRPGAWTL